MIAATPNIATVLNELADPAYKVRKNAATQLRLHYPAQALQPLCNLLTDERADVRSHAAKELGRLKNKGAVGPLLLLLQDPSVRTRVQVVRALGKLKDTSAVPPLLGALTDSRREVLMEAISALGKLRDKRAVPALLALLTQPDDNVVVNVMRALARLQDEQAVEPLMQIAASSPPQPTHWSQGRFTANQTIFALGQIGGNRVLARLLNLYENTDNSHVRFIILWVLRTIKRVQGEEKERAVELLLQVLQDKTNEVYVRCAAARALGDAFRDARVVQPLLACLVDTDNSLVSEAIVALGNNGDQEAVEPLLRTLDAEPYVTISALGRLKDSRAVEPLIRLLNPDVPAYDVEQSALIKALEQIGDLRAIEPLKVFLNHPYQYYQVVARKALAKLEKKQVAVARR